MKEFSKEKKVLLLKDLSARLPYGVICQIYDPQQDYGEDIFDARLIHIDAWTSHCNFWGCSETDPYKIEQVKPYLRPMSSMTEEEEIEYDAIFAKPWYNIFYTDTLLNAIDWFNVHHFDYRGLIEKGLAIAVTKENNPYKE